jgi:hypothetical protein
MMSHSLPFLVFFFGENCSDKDSDCATGLLCAAKHKSEQTALGYDPRKAYCGKNAGAWNFEVCYDPKKLTKKPDVKPPTDDKKVTQG